MAFLPKILPATNIALSMDVILAQSRADAELGRLDGLARYLPNPELLIAPFLNREAILSNRIEGTQTTFSELAVAQAIEDSSLIADSSDVLNYISALSYGVKQAQDRKLSRSLMNEIHERLLQGAAADKFPGRFRNRQVYVAQPGAAIAGARFVPPPSLYVPELVENLVDYLNTDETLPLLLRLAIAHYQFEAIHPYVDGNGRMGRLLIVLMLCQTRRIAAPMLYLSAYFERRRLKYYDLMLQVSMTGDWNPWLEFFLDGIASQATDALVRTQRLHDLRDDYRARLTGARKSTSALRLIDSLFKSPVTTTSRAKKLLGMTDTAALENIQKLVDARILDPPTRVGRQFYYVAREIVSAADDPMDVTTSDVDF